MAITTPRPWLASYADGVPHDIEPQQGSLYDLVREVVAVVVLNDGATFDERAIRDFARDGLTAYKVPKRVVQADDLPRSLIGKVLRREVRNSLIND
jgi:acyl-CoA synthetase (AMP-forming)/AMP-acid ligase II